MAIGPYECPNVHIDAYTVYTNNVPSGAFRGFGAPQSHFAAESQMNKLAEALGMDPVDLRLKNALRDGSTLVTQSVIPPGVSMSQVIAACAEAMGWQRAADGWRRPVAEIEKEDVGTNRKHRFTFLVATYGETGSDPGTGIECLPHNSPLAAALLGLTVDKPTRVTLPAGAAILTVRSIRNPTQLELDRLLAPIKPPEFAEE